MCLDKGNNQLLNGQYLSKSYNSMFLYFWDIISARTFLAVSVAQPTRIRIDVPANPRNAVKCAVCSTTAGPAAKIAKNVEPRTDIRLRTCRVYFILYFKQCKMNGSNSSLTSMTGFRVKQNMSVISINFQVKDMIKSVRKSWSARLEIRKLLF